jgi:hypothetical protein
MFRGMSGEHVTLELLGKQLERVIAEQNSTRDDLRVLTTIVLRLEGTLNGVLDQLHAMVSQHRRTLTPARGRANAMRACP